MVFLGWCHRDSRVGSDCGVTMKNDYLMELFILMVLGVMAVGIGWGNMANMKVYNARVCAVHGYEEDCTTPLPIERRLK